MKMTRRGLAYWMVILGVALLAVVSPAQADNDSLVEVSFTENTAPILNLSDPTQVVELSGTLTNNSDQPIRETNVHFWRSQEPITNLAELSAVLKSEPDDPLGARLTSLELGNLDKVLGEETFQPGQQTEFSVQATVGDLKLPQDGAAYLIGIHVKGNPGNDVNQTVARGRLLAIASATIPDLALVVKLASAPTQTTQGEFIDNSLEGKLSGELSKLLDVAERPGVEVMLDPSLFAEANAMALPHVVAGESRAASTAAINWVSRAADLLDRKDVWLLPYGSPDIAQTADMGKLPQALDWSTTASTNPLLASFPKATELLGAPSKEIVSSLAEHDIETVFISESNGGRYQDLELIKLSSPQLPGVPPGDTETFPQLLGRQLAEQLLSPTPCTYLITTAAAAKKVMPVVPGWNRKFVPPVAPTQQAALYETTSIAEPSTLFDALDGIATRTKFLTELTGTDAKVKVATLSAKAISSYLSEAAAKRFLAANAAADLDPDQIQISAAKQFVMGSSTNTFPITITNNSALKVQVRLTFSSSSPQRIRVPDSDLVTLEPGASHTVAVAPKATSNGVVRVETRLQTAAGTIFGEPVSVEITATDLGRVGWIIIALSGAVVLGGTFWRIRTVRAQQAKENRG